MRMEIRFIIIGFIFRSMDRGEELMCKWIKNPYKFFWCWFYVVLADSTKSMVTFHIPLLKSLDLWLEATCRKRDYLSSINNIYILFVEFWSGSSRNSIGHITQPILHSANSNRVALGWFCWVSMVLIDLSGSSWGGWLERMKMSEKGDRDAEYASISSHGNLSMCVLLHLLHHFCLFVWG